MRLKTDSNGRPVIANGHPVFVNQEGREVPIDVAELRYSAANTPTAR